MEANKIQITLTDNNKNIIGTYKVHDLYYMIARDEHTNYKLADFLVRKFHKLGVASDILTVTIMCAIHARYQYDADDFFYHVNGRILNDGTAPVSTSVLEAIVCKAFADDTVDED